MSAESIARAARNAFDTSQKLLPKGQAADRVRSDALRRLRGELEAATQEIRDANRQDIQAAQELVKSGALSASLVSRLDLFGKPGKWQSVLQGLDDVASLPSPLDVCTYASRLADRDPSTGVGSLDLHRITCPIGVLLCIFEARPEVIVNIASLALKSGNAAILKGGKESRRTAAVISRVVHSTLAHFEPKSLPPALVQTVETRDDVAELLRQDRYVDLVIPRGSNQLVRSIQRDARMPVMGHADGLCAIYVHEDAAERGTVEAIVDAKTDYPAACNSVETLLIHRAQLSFEGIWSALATALLRAGVTLRLDADSMRALPREASSSVAREGGAARVVAVDAAHDYDTEFLDLELAVKTVDSVEEAIDHINEHGSHHTDAIFCAPLAEPPVAADAAAAPTSTSTASSSSSSSSSSSAAERFTRGVGSASVFVNASTRFADGFRYGFGAEVGISTGRYHARGPVGLEGLTIYKYVARASGGGAQTAAAFSAPPTTSGAGAGAGAGGKPPRKWAHTSLVREYPSFMP